MNLSAGFEIRRFLIGTFGEKYPMGHAVQLNCHRLFTYSYYEKEANVPIFIIRAVRAAVYDNLITN